MDSSFATSVAPASRAQWHRRVLTLAFPIVLANLTQPILSAVDTAVAGHLPGPEYIGGVALGGVSCGCALLAGLALRLRSSALPPLCKALWTKVWPGPLVCLLGLQ